MWHIEYIQYVSHDSKNIPKHRGQCVINRTSFCKNVIHIKVLQFVDVYRKLHRNVKHIFASVEIRKNERAF